MKKFNIMMVIFLLGNKIFAQQNPNAAHFMFQLPSINPALSGYKNWIDIYSNYRKQWLNFSDQSPLVKTQYAGSTIDKPISNVGPSTQIFGVSVPIIKYNHNLQACKNYGGINLMFVNDYLGYEKNTLVKLGIAYRFWLPNYAFLRFGLDGIYHYKSINGDKLRYHDPNDPLIPAGNAGDGKVLANTGVAYENPVANNLLIGFSIQNLNTAKWQYQNFMHNTIDIKSAKHYFLFASIVKSNWLRNPLLSLQPSILFKSSQDIKGILKPSIDIQAIAMYNKLYSVGLNWRSDKIVFGVDALTVMFGFYPKLLNKAKNEDKSEFRIGYSYDITLSNFSKSQIGTHEIQLNYRIYIGCKKCHYSHPQWMERSVISGRKNFKPCNCIDSK